MNDEQYIQGQKAGAPAAVLLLADGDAANREWRADSLRSRGFIVHLVGSGVETLEAAEAEQPDLILLDSRLPDTDGTQAIEALKANPDTAGIPVLVLASSLLRHESAHCRAAGAVRVVIKPVSIEELLTAIRPCIRAP